MYASDSPSVDPLVFELGVPVLYVVFRTATRMTRRSLTCLRRGVCFGNQLIGIFFAPESCPDETLGEID